MKTCFTNYDLKFSARAASAPPSRNPSYSVVSANMCSSSSPLKWLACHNSLCWTLFQCMSLHRDTRREILYWMAYRVSIRCMNIFQWLSTDRYLHMHISDSDILLCDTSLPSDASSSGHYMPLELVALVQYSLSYIPVGSGACFPCRRAAGLLSV